MLNNSLERDFMIDRPRIAVLSRNPRGCDGTGSEENEIIEPAIALIQHSVRLPHGISILSDAATIIAIDGVDGNRTAIINRTIED